MVRRPRRSLRRRCAGPRAERSGGRGAAAGGPRARPSGRSAIGSASPRRRSIGICRTATPRSASRAAPVRPCTRCSMGCSTDWGELPIATTRTFSIVKRANTSLRLLDTSAPSSARPSVLGTRSGCRGGLRGRRAGQPWHSGPPVEQLKMQWAPLRELDRPALRHQSPAQAVRPGGISGHLGGPSRR